MYRTAPQTRGRVSLVMIALAAVLSFVLLPLSAAGQSGAGGTLSGIVQDPNGASMPGVSVTVRNIATDASRTVTSNDDGRWTLPGLSIGTYQITYELAGFKKLVRDGITVEASVPRALEDKLEIGDVGAVVNITGGESQVAAETATTFRQLSSDDLVSVPTSTRSFTQLLSTEAGVNTELSPVLTNGNGNQSPSVNGTRTTSTSLFFNGIDATNITSNEGSLNDNIAPAPETLQEVKLQTSLYDASTGRSGGGNFQLVTKQGGNTFNGSAYYFLQNEKLNANDFFFNKEGIARPKARRNEAGFTLGGPIVKDRFFFFGSYQYTDAITGFVPTARSTTVLPLALRRITGARTSQNLADAFNAENGCTVGVNCLSAADVTPLAVRLFNLVNPVTGDFVIPAPRANARAIGIDRAGARAFQFGFAPGVVSRTLRENNPLVQQLNVQPSEFKQHQATARLDGRLSKSNTLSGVFFMSNFPALDSFPDPSSLASPFTLRRADQNRTLAISDQHIFSPTVINEARFGYFMLNNTRTLDDPFLTEEFTSAALGISNPALLFDDSPGTRRLGHFIGRPGTNMSQFSFGGPNDSFNRRKQQTFSFSDNLTWIKGSHTLRFGGDLKRHQYDSSLPEEQATEFEKFDSFTQLLTGNATEADTQFGLTSKSFRFRDYSAYVADDWKVTNKLSLNLGLRYELFMWPTEKDGRIGNFDFSSFAPCFNQSGGSNALCDSPSPGFIVPGNVQSTGLGNVDAAVAATAKAGNNHTLNGQDLNNFAPRIGFAYSPLESKRLVVRGGFGFFYDRPSASFINTVFSNYPFLREIEITVPSGSVPIENAFGAQPTTLPLSSWLPFRVTRGSGTGGSYVIRDNTGVSRDPRGTSTGSATGNIAETFEFRAVDRDLKTPYVQQWNLGFQYEVTKSLLFEARYVGTRGKNLLQAIAFNQGFDLNDANTPDHIYQRFNDAYIAAGSPNGALNAGSTARERGTGRAFGFANPYRVGSSATCAGGILGGVTGSPLDLNLANPITCSGTTIGGGQIINFEARVPVLGFNVPEALLLRSNGESSYHGAQFSVTQRLSRGLHFNAAYTWSKSMDTSSTDPGSTAGSGKPDVPNTGFVVQGDQRNLEANRSVSDFDRTHRFSLNFVYDIPTSSNSKLLKGWQLSGFFQAQTGTPYSIFAPEPELQTAPQYLDLVRGSGGLYRLGFGRPSVCGELNQQGADITESAFNRSALCTAFGQNGSLGRNVLRGPMQSRFDLGLLKTTKLTESVAVEFGWDVFNVFNKANFGSPDSELGSPDFGRITNTIGGPRVMQFRAKLKF